MKKPYLYGNASTTASCYPSTVVRWSWGRAITPPLRVSACKIRTPLPGTRKDMIKPFRAKHDSKNHFPFAQNGETQRSGEGRKVWNAATCIYLSLPVRVGNHWWKALATTFRLQINRKSFVSKASAIVFYFPNEAFSWNCAQQNGEIVSLNITWNVTRGHVSHTRFGSKNRKPHLREMIDNDPQQPTTTCFLYIHTHG